MSTDITTDRGQHTEKSGDFGTICLGWWRGLTDPSIGRSRADLARLKRAGGAVDVLAIRAVHELNRALAAAGHDMRSAPDRLALIAQVLAQVKEHTGQRLAQRMGQGDPKPLSEIRFDRLIRTRDLTKPEELAELATQLRRALAVVGPAANVARLAQDLRWWTDATRASWCFDYYGASQAAPTTEDMSEESEA